jgi:hypothetical protein
MIKINIILIITNNLLLLLNINIIIINNKNIKNLFISFIIIIIK